MHKYCHGEDLEALENKTLLVRQCQLRQSPIPYHFQFHFHFSSDVNALLSHFFDCVQLPFINTDRRKDGWIPKISIRIRTETHLTCSDQRMSCLQIGNRRIFERKHFLRSQRTLVCFCCWLLLSLSFSCIWISLKSTFHRRLSNSCSYLQFRYSTSDTTINTINAPPAIPAEISPV